MGINKGSTPNTRVGLYARISKDDEGTGLGVGRQEKDGRYDIAERGLELVRVYVDDDLSASGTTFRPSYQDMLADLRDGAIDAVWSYDVDRLQRSLREFVEFVEVCEQAKARVYWPEGEADFARGIGIDELENRALAARRELRTLKKRVIRKMAELRSDGKWHGGSVPFGYEYVPGKGELMIVEKEAEVLREAAQRSLSGESLGALCEDFERRGIRSKTGKLFVPTTLGKILTSAAISGRIEHGGEIVGPATWQAIISTADSDQLRRTRKQHGIRVGRRSHLLAGLIFCGKCGMPLVSGTRNGRPIFVCRTGPGFRGCGGVTISEQPVEQIVVRDAIAKIDSGVLNAELHGSRAEDIDTAERELAEVSEDLKELTRQYFAREILPAEYEGARDGLRQRHAQLTAELESAQRGLNVPQLPSPLAPHWRDLGRKGPSKQRAALKMVLAGIVILPASKMGRGFDEGRVQLQWKV